MSCLRRRPPLRLRRRPPLAALASGGSYSLTLDNPARERPAGEADGRWLSLSRIGPLAVAAGLVVAACGGGASGSSATPTAPANPDLTVHAEEIKFDKKAYTVHGGEVKIAYPNDGTQTHTLVVQDPKGDKVGDTLRVAPGKETGGAYQLAPGEYTLYCDITGHREAGMVASLTVTG
ncbi:MAG TPA: hypothetical protein VGF22_18005 [Acidimicrobiales bacterium]|jgi:plastocyanin